jgi:hypothetical protein
MEVVAIAQEIRPHRHHDVGRQAALLGQRQHDRDEIFGFGALFRYAKFDAEAEWVSGLALGQPQPQNRDMCQIPACGGSVL